MKRELKFAHSFPSYHPKKGKPTGFAEAVEAAITGKVTISDFGKKKHTLRMTFKWESGDTALLKQWEGRPYHTKSVDLLPDIKEVDIAFVHEFEIKPATIGLPYFYIDGKEQELNLIREVALNDGLSFADFKEWFHDFRQPMKGQIIQWWPEQLYNV